MNKKRYRTIDEVEVDYYLKHPNEIKHYIESVLEDFQENGNKESFYKSLAIITKVKGGFAKISKKTGLNRESLYKALSTKSDPRFSTVIQILHAIGIKIKVA